MPRKPKKPCRYPGCPNLTEALYCETHKTLVNQQYDKYKRSETRSRYQGNWARIRRAYIQAHPYCEICFDEGRMIPANLVHHKIPLAEGGTNAADNLQSLCKSCHSRLHAERGDYLGNTKRSLF